MIFIKNEREIKIKINNVICNCNQNTRILVSLLKLRIMKQVSL